MGGQTRWIKDGGRRTKPRRPALRIPSVVWLFVFCPLSFVFCPLPFSAAQTAAGDGTYYSQRPEFKIPFQTDPNERRIKQVELYVSRDLGRSWQPVATAQPTERGFRFQAQQDGWYYFAVRTIDFQGQAFPPTQDQF